MKYIELLKTIKETRKEKGIKQDDVADELGMDRTNYGRKENGIIPMTVEELFKIAEMLELSLTVQA